MVHIVAGAGCLVNVLLAFRNRNYHSALGWGCAALYALVDGIKEFV